MWRSIFQFSKLSRTLTAIRAGPSAPVPHLRIDGFILIFHDMSFKIVEKSINVVTAWPLSFTGRRMGSFATLAVCIQQSAQQAQAIMNL